jgi:hypothetical protein
MSLADIIFDMLVAKEVCLPARLPIVGLFFV